MFDLQNFIFENKLTRNELLNYSSQGENNKKFRISIYRNHSFELIENTINPFLDYAKIEAEFLYSDYDDSLSFLNLDLESDLVILWLDFTRYNNDNINEFIKERIDYLTSIYSKKILSI